MTEPTSNARRTLHVLDAHRAAWGLLHAIACLAQSDAHRVLLLGNTRDARRARDAGIRRASRIQPRSNDPANATRTIRRALRNAPPFDRVLAWDERSGRALGGLVTEADRDLPESIEGAYPQRALERADVRRQWSVDEGVRVIIPADDHPSSVDAMRMCYIAGVLSVAGTHALAVAPSTARNLDRAARFAWRHGRARWLMIDDRPPLLLRDAADAVWWQRSGTPDTGLTLRMLIHSGVPAAADRAEQTENIQAGNLQLCDPSHELAPTTALSHQLSRIDGHPDQDAFRRDVEAQRAGACSFTGVVG